MREPSVAERVDGSAELRRRQAVVRGAVDRHPVRLGVASLHAGGVLGIFPEGTRGDGVVRTAKPGVGYFALRSERYADDRPLNRGLVADTTESVRAALADLVAATAATALDRTEGLAA